MDINKTILEGRDAREFMTWFNFNVIKYGQITEYDVLAHLMLISNYDKVSYETQIRGWTEMITLSNFEEEFKSDNFLRYFKLNLPEAKRLI